MKILKNRKKLDNKGFTLIELLAVVVILAVVMGIAMSSVLSSMNKARGGSLSDSAISIAQTFNTKYTESLVDGVPSDVYGDVLGSGSGYNFQATSKYYLDTKLAATFNISAASYALTSKSTALSTTGVANSFISYNNTTGKFIVCMVANTSGNYYVKAYATTAATKLSALKKPSTDTTIKDITVAANTMIACSDGTKSW